MLRKDKILAVFKQSTNELTTNEIAKQTAISRENVSRILTVLVNEGAISKSNSKPVLYKLAPTEKNKKGVFIDFLAKNPSMKKAISQAQSSIMYPPNGINTLIVGETGVGKSMFVQLMHQFSIETNSLTSDAPFVLLNCADYSQNPELLMGILFGIKKGAYTGADQDKKGLIELADNGLLFLDEIHNLPQEGQELLFTFIDQGIFRRLGESEVQRQASVRIIGATSEAIESTLVGPFRRRMPMLIEIPNLENRSEAERAILIRDIFEQESRNLSKEVAISKDVFISLLYYKCDYNIGQLKSDIQLLCAKGYSEFLLGNKAEIELNMLDLPEYIATGLLETTNHRNLRNKADFYSQETLRFFPEKNQKTNEHSIYSLLKNTMDDTKVDVIDEQRLKTLMEKEINDYFSFIEERNLSTKSLSLESVIQPKRLEIIYEVMEFVMSELNLVWDQNIQMGFIIHTNNMLERSKNLTVDHYDYPFNMMERVQQHQEYAVALKCLKKLSYAEQFQIPYSEIEHMVSFFKHSKSHSKKDEQIQIVVVAHGESTATSMVNAVNTLLKNENLIGIDAPLTEKPLVVMRNVIKKIKTSNHGQDVLCLVDMGSFTQLSHLIEKELKVKSMAIPLVSTLHVLEVSRKAVLGNRLVDIYNDLLKVDFSFFGLKPEKNLSIQEVSPIPKKQAADFVVLTCCLTGHGTAMYLKGLLEKALEDEVIPIQIEALQLVDSKQDYEAIKKIEATKNILAIVSTFDVNHSAPQFNIYDIINGEGIETIKELTQQVNVKKEIRLSLQMELKAVEGGILFDDIALLNDTILKTFALEQNQNELIGILMHICVLINKLKDQNFVKPEETPFIIHENYDSQLQQLEQLFYPVEKKYTVKLTQKDYYHILEYYFHLR